MKSLDLSFACGDESLVVRRFTLRESMSSPFELSLFATSTDDDLSLDAFVGRSAALRAVSGTGVSRVFRGVCDAMELVTTRVSDSSEYFVRIVPEVALLDQRRNYRVFQHKSVPGIAVDMLEEWGIEAVARLSSERFPDLEYRVQHGESDLAFLGRVLEEAGISYFFETDGDDTRLVLAAAPHAASPRRDPIVYIDREGWAETSFIRDLKVREEVRPGRVTVRDFDFRRSTDYQLVGRARTGISEEDRLEHYRYEPGSFVVESRSTDGSARPTAQSDETEGQSQAARRLGAERERRQSLTFETNVFDLGPGSVFSVDRHPRSDLSREKRLLVTELTTEWIEKGEPLSKGRAVFADRPFFPPRRSSKTRVHGVESAVVVGPPGEEIHTDEFGRVRVQFHWDRDGQLDDGSSCWIRVSQGWAGGAFGMLALPRVGQEVLVGYLGGDPDQPVVVGRLFNGPSAPPYKLPENRTKTAWKSRSSPGGDGFNELMFEDARGQELVYMHAERNLDCVVKVDESAWIGNDRSETVGRDETVHIGRNRSTRVVDTDAIQVGVRHAVSVEQRSGSAGATPTGIEMVDGRITLSSGRATLTLDGPDLTLDAARAILLKAASDISLQAASKITAHADVSLTLQAGATLVVRSEAGDVIIQGGPIVRINPEVLPSAALRTALQPENALRSVDVPRGVDIDAETALAEEHARFDEGAPQWLSDRIAPGGAWDYERLGAQYAAYTSFHLGVIGAAMGLPEGALLRQAGMIRRAKGNSKPEWGDPGNGITGGTYPYGADPEHQEMLFRGSAFYERRFG